MQFIVLWPFSSKEMSANIKMVGKAAAGLVPHFKVNIQIVNVLFMKGVDSETKKRLGFSKSASQTNALLVRTSQQLKITPPTCIYSIIIMLESKLNFVFLLWGRGRNEKT